MMNFVNAISLIVVAALVGLVYTSKESAGSDLEALAKLQAELARERGRISALEAEIAHREDPENLRRLARHYLGFEPVRHDQEVAFSELPRLSAQPDERTGAQAAMAAVRTSSGPAPAPVISGGRP